MTLPIVRLFQIPPDSLIYGLDVDPDRPARHHRLDGAYSLCRTLPHGRLVSVAGWTPLVAYRDGYRLATEAEVIACADGGEPTDTDRADGQVNTRRTERPASRHEPRTN
jgi:hypothetical protein